MEDRYIRIKELISLLGISRGTIYRLLKENKFPRQIKLTEHTSVWRLSEINNWVTEREKQI